MKQLKFQSWSRFNFFVCRIHLSLNRKPIESEDQIWEEERFPIPFSLSALRCWSQESGDVSVLLWVTKLSLILWEGHVTEKPFASNVWRLKSYCSSKQKTENDNNKKSWQQHKRTSSGREDYVKRRWKKVEKKDWEKRWSWWWFVTFLSQRQGKQSWEGTQLLLWYPLFFCCLQHQNISRTRDTMM